MNAFALTNLRMGYECFFLRGIVQCQHKNLKAHEKEKVTICMPEIINKKSQKVSVIKYKSKIDQSAHNKNHREKKTKMIKKRNKSHTEETPFPHAGRNTKIL